MNINELREARIFAEETIQRALVNLQEATGMNVADVKVTFHDTNYSIVQAVPRRIVGRVEIDLRVP